MIGIHHIQDMKGKTVHDVKQLDWGTYLGIIFTDQTYVVLRVQYTGDSVSIELDDYPEAYVLKELGVITEKEYNYLKENLARAYRQLAIQRSKANPMPKGDGDV